MKTYKNTILIVVSTLFLLSACEDGDSVGESQINTEAPILNELDIWLRANFVTPYNIDVRYKWDINDSDVERFLHPPFEFNVMPIAEVLQSVWIEPYLRTGGDNFIANISPRQIIIAGGFNFNPNSPTITLGVAEAGVTITLFNVDFLDFSSVESVKAPLKTVQHEYAHILNQNRPVDPAYAQINPEDYDSDWFNRSDEEARQLGYITAYASSQSSEDFVEMVSEMLTNSRTEFDALIEGINDERAIQILRRKEAIVVDYYRTQFGIDIYELQELTEQATQEFVNQ